MKAPTPLQVRFTSHKIQQCDNVDHCTVDVLLLTCRSVVVTGIEREKEKSGFSGVPRNFIPGGSTNSVEDRENGDLGAVAP
jgi:hypothetical protein